MAAVAAAAHIGTCSRRRTADAEAARHGRSGPIPIRNRSSNATGAVLRLKNGEPTETLPPVTASASSG